jgi:hypothetical protein
MRGTGKTGLMSPPNNDAMKRGSSNKTVALSGGGKKPLLPGKIKESDNKMKEVPIKEE